MLNFLASLCCCFGIGSGNHDDVDKASERTRLLRRPLSSESLYARQQQMMINRRQEEEMLGQIVHRMSENLIDISSTNVAERLQQQGHVYRSVEYREVLSSIVLPDDLMASLDEIPRKSSRWFEIPPEKDKEVGPDWSQEDADRMTAARAEIKQAVDDMQLKDPGDLVVSLTSEA